MLIFFMTLLSSATNNDNPHTSSHSRRWSSHKGYLNTIRWETSRDCQYSSGTKLVWTRKQLISLNTTQNTTTLALSTPVESNNHVILAVLFFIITYLINMTSLFCPDMKLSHVWVPPSFRGESSFFEYSWECRFLSFTSSTLFPNCRRDRMFSIRTLCLSCLHSLLPT